MVMQHVGIDGAMKQMFANEAEIAVDGRRSAAEEGEARGRVVGEGEICVVEVGYCYCWIGCQLFSLHTPRRCKHVTRSDMIW